MSTPTKQATTDEHLSAVNELVELEERNLSQGLSTAERERWLSLVHRLFVGGEFEERRRFFRISTQSTARILEGVGSGSVSAEVTSLSAGGLFLRTTEVDPDLLGRELEIEVAFPRALEQTYRFKVQVCRVASSGESACPGLGVTFSNLDQEQRGFLLEQLRRHLVDLIEISREKYHFFFQHSMDAALLLSPEGTIQEASAATVAFLGLPLDGILGRSLASFLPRDQLSHFQQALNRVLRQERVRLQTDLRGGDGTPLPVEMALSPFQMRDLKVGVILVAHDLREQRRIQAQQQELERRLCLADKMAAIGQITASIAHDINNPLAYVLTNLSLLQEYLAPLQTLLGKAREQPGGEAPASEAVPSATELGELVEESVEGCRRIRDILLDIRQFSRMDSQAAARIDLNGTLEASLRIVRNLIQHTARLERSFAGDLPQTYLNPSRVTQVFLNLLTNAVQAFAGADVQRNLIQVSTCREQGKLQVTIADNGRGIPEEIREKIFTPFFTTRQQSGGTGLGLSIVKECIDALGGELEVDSSPARGTRIVVRLPIRRESRPEQRVVPLPSAGPRQRVLLIDDDPILLRSMERTLARHVQVVSTESPGQALAMLRDQPFDTILCDVMMPEMNGLAFRDLVAQQQPELARKIIFITGGTFTVEQERELAASKNLVLIKPLDITLLLSLLKAPH